MEDKTSNMINNKLTTLSNDITYIKKKVNKIDETINGNGKDGMKIEVDRLKQTKKIITWFLSIFVVAFLTYLVAINAR